MLEAQVANGYVMLADNVAWWSNGQVKFGKVYRISQDVGQGHPRLGVQRRVKWYAPNSAEDRFRTVRVTLSSLHNVVKITGSVPPT